STYLLTDELQFLMVRAIPPNTLFAARYIEATVYSSWMVLSFGLAVFIAAGVTASAAAGYYLWLGVVLVPFVSIPASLAALFVLVLANLMPVKRTRDVMLAIGVMAVVGLFMLVRSLEPERMFNPQNFAST